ncbi:hypothetical protein BDR22DRAFT_853555 [Usnea florida]
MARLPWLVIYSFGWLFLIDTSARIFLDGFHYWWCSVLEMESIVSQEWKVKLQLCVVIPVWMCLSLHSYLKLYDLEIVLRPKSSPSMRQMHVDSVPEDPPRYTASKSAYPLPDGYDE